MNEETTMSESTDETVELDALEDETDHIYSTCPCGATLSASGNCGHLVSVINVFVRAHRECSQQWLAGNMAEILERASDVGP